MIELEEITMEVPNTEEPDENIHNFVEKPQYTPMGIEDPRWLGNCLAFCYHNHNPRFTIGPHWGFFLGMNIFVITLSVLFLSFVISKVTLLGTIGGAVLLIIQVGSYTVCSLVNPGIPDRNQRCEPLDLSDEEKNTYCRFCKIVRTPESKTFHCHYCEVCVEGHDHHCAWTGKCIGKKNLVFFNFFVGITLFLAFYIAMASCLCIGYLQKPHKQRLYYINLKESSIKDHLLQGAKTKQIS